MSYLPFVMDALIKLAGVCFAAWLASKAKEISQTGKENRVLLDGNMTAALRLTSELSSWKASETQNIADIAAAERAKKNLDEHVERVTQMDAGK